MDRINNKENLDKFNQTFLLPNDKNEKCLIISEKNRMPNEKMKNKSNIDVREEDIKLKRKKF